MRWALLAILFAGCGADTTRASETPAARDIGQAAPSEADPSEPCAPLAEVAGNGDCDAFFEGAYVDRSTGRCVAGSASGCNADFPFDTLEACRARCEPRSEPAPAAPSARLALAHRADDGRVFVELPGGGALEPP